jgi:hypothetical protein
MISHPDKSNESTYAFGRNRRTRCGGGGASIASALRLRACGAGNSHAADEAPGAFLEAAAFFGAGFGFAEGAGAISVALEPDAVPIVASAGSSPTSESAATAFDLGLPEAAPGSCSAAAPFRALGFFLGGGAAAGAAGVEATAGEATFVAGFRAAETGAEVDTAAVVVAFFRARLAVGLGGALSEGSCRIGTEMHKMCVQ